MKGFDRQGNIINPCDWPIGDVLNEDCTTLNPYFWYSGDPVTQNGWLCNIKTDHRLMVNTGPFTLEKDKPQEIIIAYIIGRGTDYFNSITVSRKIAKDVIGFYNSNFTEIPVGVKQSKSEIIPTKFALEQNYPNPFNPTTTIKYQIPNQVRDDNSSVIARSETTKQSNVETHGHASVRLVVYDILGREVTTLVNQKQKPGTYEVIFDASKYSSGVYYYQLKVGQFIKTKKMMLLK
ncbi:MAG: T9SS type A sorting domain-containing protein [Ignavibacteriales bacterium]|nr:T9SS type A sorting domain-containing protein [Ignavibacteriales bacterium]MCB9258820.1 T9SS type A sorting domain-containing protein [Ignavibacteriales bacterium]